MRPRSLLPASLLALAVAGAGALAVPPATAATSPCAHQRRIDVPRAPMQKTACLDDLTTAGTVAAATPTSTTGPA